MSQFTRYSISNRRFLWQVGGLAHGSLACSVGIADEPKDPLIEHVQLDRVRSGYDMVHCRVHPRAGAIPGMIPTVVMTMQQLLLSDSDVFGPLHEMGTSDLGRAWAGPDLHANLGRRPKAELLETHICDFTPSWHATAPTRKAHQDAESFVARDVHQNGS
ncbi:MAG: hypothetical protein IT428_17595 [Planctomycetaceae bacterium]|nr:hypothetical protein [Planctomycetaceae bacterium]